MKRYVLLMLGPVSLAVLIAAGPSHLRLDSRVGELGSGRVLVPTGQLLVPGSAVVTIAIPGRPVDMALSPDGKLLAVLHDHGVDLVDISGRRVIRRVATGPTSYMGVIFTADGQFIYTCELAKTGAAQLVKMPVRKEAPPGRLALPDGSVPAGLALARDSGLAYVCLTRRNTVAVINLESGAVVKEIAAGVAPVSIVLNGSKAYVANWGGERPGPADPSALSSNTPTRVDPDTGIASSGAVSVIDLDKQETMASIAVGLHPVGMALSADGKLLAVANANSDSVSLIETASDSVRETIQLAPLPEGRFGSSPTAVAFDAGGRLFIACGTNNAVGVAARQDSAYRVQGWLPTGWYPAALRLAADGALWVANIKGTGSRGRKGDAPYSVYNYLGSVQQMRIPAARELERMSQEAAEANSPFGPPPATPVADLGKLGIQHVFFIIKENRTYDQILGDLGRGEGDPSLAIYGREITPNHRALALRYVVLDNFYASGAVSADGHQWLTQAFVVDYLERAFAAWPRSYPYAGGDPLAYAASGFLWDNAARHGKTVRVYGEYADPRYKLPKHSWTDFFRDLDNDPPQLKVEARSEVTPLNRFLDAGYPAFHMGIPDQWRLREFLREFREYERTGDLPNLVIIMLPADHTVGTRPGFPTPRAMVADNDLALGKMVEAVSRSRFWPRSVIAMTEDDAQNGTDHVDGHRTIALFAGPHVRRGGAVISTAFNHINLLRTVEEILGLPPMNKFDAAAHPMRAVFTETPNPEPYKALPNNIRLEEINPPLKALRGPALEAARDSLAMNFTEPDDVPEDRLNRIQWHTARGWDAPFPGVRHRSQ